MADQIVKTVHEEPFVQSEADAQEAADLRAQLEDLESQIDQYDEDGLVDPNEDRNLQTQDELDQEILENTEEDSSQIDDNSLEVPQQEQDTQEEISQPEDESPKVNSEVEELKDKLNRKIERYERQFGEDNRFKREVLTKLEQLEKENRELKEQNKAKPEDYESYADDLNQEAWEHQRNGNEAEAENVRRKERQYRDYARKLRNDQNREAAEKQASKTNVNQNWRSDPTSPQFVQEWQRNQAELERANPDMLDSSSELYKAAEELCQDPNNKLMFTSTPDGVIHLVNTAKMLVAERSKILESKQKNEALKSENKTLKRNVTPSRHGNQTRFKTSNSIHERAQRGEYLDYKELRSLVSEFERSR